MLSSPSRLKVLILDYPKSTTLKIFEIEKFMSNGFDVTFNTNRCDSDLKDLRKQFSSRIKYVNLDIFNTSELIEAIQENEGFHVIKLRSSITIDTDVIDVGINQLNPLKVIAQTGTGIDHIDDQYAQMRGVKVVNTPGTNANAVAEFVIAQIFMLARNISHHNYQCHQEVWSIPEEIGHFEIKQKVLGIIGLGTISKLLAQKGSALGMQVHACDISHARLTPAHYQACKVIDFDTLLTTSDFVSIHIPLAPNTYKLMGERELRQMKHGSFLINAARGGIVDEMALHKILSEKNSNIFGAAIDTHENEGLKYSSPLRGHKRVILSPHIAGSTYESTIQASTTLISRIINAI